MTVQQLSSEAFAAYIEQAERGHVPAGLHPEDAAHLAFALRLADLRERPPAPATPPWRSDGEVAVRSASNSITPRPSASRASVPLPPASRARAPLPPIAFPIGRRLRLDVLVVVALLAAIALFGWQTLGRFDPDATIRMKPPIAMPPSALPEQRGTPPSGKAFGDSRDRPPLSGPAATVTSTQQAAYPPPPSSPSAAPVVTPTLAIVPPTDPAATRVRPLASPVDASATPEQPRAATRSAEQATRAREPQPAYPGPGETLTPEPRVTRIAPPPVPTRAPTVPTPPPTAAASPTMRPLPTFPATPTARPLPETPTARPTDPSEPSATVQPTSAAPSDQPTPPAPIAMRSRRIPR